MDEEMKEADERSRTRIGIIFREFKNELESYVPPGTEKIKPGAKGKSQGNQQVKIYCFWKSNKANLTD